MLITPLKTDGLCLFPSTCLFVRVSGSAVEVITTEGAMRIETDRPRFLLRGLEREIDELVYALYGLTRDEVKIVEQATK
jgi:hypothetical protein